MTRKLSLLSGLGLLLAGLVVISSPAEEKAATGKDAVPVEDKAGQANADKMITALKLKALGWGKQTRRGIEDANVELLIAAARLLRDLPAPKKLEDATVEVTKEKDTPEGTETTLPEGEVFNPAKEAQAILERASELVKDTVTDKKKAEAYNTLIQELKEQGQTRAVEGGPKAVRRTIPAGQTQTYNWHWHAHLPGVVAFQSNLPMRLQVVQDNGGYIFADGITMGATPQFLPGGPGRPAANKKVRITVRVRNLARTPGVYVLAAQ